MKILENNFALYARVVAACVAAAVIAGCGGGGSGNTTSMTQSSGTLPPTTVSSTSPGNGAIGVGTNTKITASFSTAMSASSITSTTFTVAASGNAMVSGAVSRSLCSAMTLTGKKVNTA